MEINHATAIYFSPTGTTQKTVAAIAEGAGVNFRLIDLTLPESRQSSLRSFSQQELVIVGLPVYAGRLPMDLDDFFSGLQGDSTPAAAVVLYGNREYNDALIELKMRLEERGFRVKSAAAFIGEHTFSSKIATGRPDHADLAVAAEFGKKTLLTIIEEVSGKLELKGDYPFKWKGYNPRAHVDFPPHPRLVTTDSCTQCKLCAELCPWGAIDHADCKIRNYEKCMICYRCRKICPPQAIQVRGDKFLQFLPQFESRLNAQRCQPELFLMQSVTRHDG